MNGKNLRDRVLAFMDRVEREDIHLYAFRLSAGGEEKASCFWGGFEESRPWRVYSVSKTMTAVAIGMLAEDGRLNLDERICGYFRDFLPQGPSPELSALTIRDMLRMATCYDNATYREGIDFCWARTFFEAKPDHDPGTVFNYDTSCSQVLAELVERISGKDVLTLLRERLFAPLGAEDPKHWLRDPSGCPQGGSGLCMSLRDFHKVSECLLEGGRGVIPAWFVREMQKKQIDTPLRPYPEEQHGYGWQCWRTRAGWSMYGMGGQLAILCPDKRTVMTTIGDTRLDGCGVQRIYDAFFEEIWPYTEEETMEPETFRRPLPALSSPAAPEQEEGGPWFFGENSLGLCSLRLPGRDRLELVTLRGKKELTFGIGRVLECSWPGAEEVPALCCGGWLSPRVLRVRCHAAGDAPCGFDMLAVFGENAVTVHCRRSRDPLTEGWEGTATGRKK